MVGVSVMSRISSKTTIKITKATKFLLVFYIFLLSFSKLSTASEPIEKDSTDAGDVAMASVWIISEIAQGGYLKPAINLTNLNNDVNLMWEFEAGWRFTNWFKFGASLKRTMTEVDSINNYVTSFGFVAGASGRNSMLGNFTIDLNIGSFEKGDTEFSQYFIEPGIHIKQRLYKQLYWTSGITYRYVEDESFAFFGNDSFNSISLKLGLTNKKY